MPAVKKHNRRKPARSIGALPLACGMALMVQACSNGPPDGLAYLGGDGALRPSTRSLLQLGDAAQQRSDYVAATSFYSRARDEEPDARTVLLRLGTSLIDLHAYNQALDLFRRAQKQMPNDPEVAFRLGELYLKTGDALAALDQFETSLSIRRDDPRVFNAIGVAYSMQRRYDLAQKYYRAGLQLAPGQARLLNNLALAQYLAGDETHAAETLASLASRADATPRQRQNLATLEALSSRGPGDRDALLGVHFAGETSSGPALATARSNPPPVPPHTAQAGEPAATAAPEVARAPTSPPAAIVDPATAAATALAALPQPPAATTSASPSAPSGDEPKHLAPVVKSPAATGSAPAPVAKQPEAGPDDPPAIGAPVTSAQSVTAMAGAAPGAEPAPAPVPPKGETAKPAPVAPVSTAMPALPRGPVQQTALAPLLNAIQPTASVRAPEPAPRQNLVDRRPQEHVRRFYYCVRSAVPIDHDTAAQHARLAHGTYSIDPLIIRIRPDGNSGDSANPASISARFTVQFAAFATEDNASRFAEELQRSGVAAKILLLPRNEAPAASGPSADAEKLVL